MTEVGLLVGTAVTIGVVHTLLGPDHYIPFVAMAQANRWSTARTMALTTVCGIAHVLSSVLIGVVGLVLGTLVFQLETMESFRGDTAAWLLIGFGLAYTVYGIYRIYRGKPHHHGLPKVDTGSADASESTLSKTKSSRGWSPWFLFLIFAFGPCESLIPMLMYPAAKANWVAILAVVVAFLLATVATMLAAVFVLHRGLSWLQLPNMHRFSHALAGVAILVCGLGVKFGL